MRAPCCGLQVRCLTTSPNKEQTMLDRAYNDVDEILKEHLREGLSSARNEGGPIKTFMFPDIEAALWAAYKAGRQLEKESTAHALGKVLGYELEVKEEQKQGAIR
jgi:hypothetical protein